MSETGPTQRGDTVAQLKADIDAGRTGDKVANADPGLSPLGTDDEAAGTPASPERIALARRTEAKSFEPVRDTRATPWVTAIMPVTVAVIAAALVGFVFWMRH